MVSKLALTHTPDLSDQRGEVLTLSDPRLTESYKRNMILVWLSVNHYKQLKLLYSLLLLLVCGSAGGIFGFPRLVYSPRYSRRGRRGRRLPPPSTVNPVNRMITLFLVTVLHIMRLNRLLQHDHMFAHQ